MAWSWMAFWRLFHRGPSVELARRLFQQQRERLELLFFQMVSASGKPRGLRWKTIDWESGVEFARERASGRLAALVGVTIQFEAVAGSDMEGLPAVGNLRNASAVFFFHGGRWHTLGKTVFNLNPDEALAHFRNQYERLSSGK
ncbi:MAG TPA: hypothetical protein VH682_02605 [Gemmataceae bacterium]